MVTPRLFTLEEAAALLTVLEPLLQGLQQKLDELQQKQEALDALAGQRSEGNGYNLERENRARVAKSEIEELTKEMQQGVQEVHTYGCELKDIKAGLIDFRTLRDGSVVYLCWRLGERAIAHWHDLDAGIAGRQPL